MDPRVTLGYKVQLEAHFGPFGDIARNTVCVERTIGSEIILDGPDVTPR